MHSLRIFGYADGFLMDAFAFKVGEVGVLCLKLKVFFEVATKHSSVKGAGNQESCHSRVLLFTDPAFGATC
ncbi:hypothetical protein [Stenotrophomonas sp. PS02298]|uniref:hypothetical protein n=1 Tax=Stenotrophomonas sp. PS02298 TaxID=2991424 RepID=UPI00249CF308|nr:hypothetical protein [Stenotrophomonas sp. PS02298]